MVSKDYQDYVDTGLHYSEKVFDKFVESEYNVNEVPIDDVHHVAMEWAVKLVPVNYAMASWQHQEARGNTIPWKFNKLVQRLRGALWEAERKLKRQQEDLIEARKELSRLKRLQK
jgi:DICT domain-containing protein